MRAPFVSVSGLALLVVVPAAVACGTQSPSPANREGASSSSTAPSSSSSATSASASSASGGTSSSSAASSVASGSGHAAPLPALHVQGNQIVDASGKPVVLRGVAVPDIGTLFAQGNGIAGITGRIDEIVGAAGLAARAIRLPVYPRTVVNGGSPSYSPVPYPVGATPPGEAGAKMELAASDYVAQVLRPAVDYAASKGLYAIVDFHQIDDVTTGASSADAVTFWTTVAPVFADNPNVIYEAFNEPIDNKANAGIAADGTWTSAFTTAAQSWVTAIRAGAPNTLIIVGSPSWSQYPDGALTAGLTGGNLAFTAHIYPGNWPGTSNGFQNRVAKAAMGEPVAITEWGYQIGTARSNLTTPDDTWAQSLQAFVESGGESWTAWVADPSWGPPMFTRAAGQPMNAFNGLNDFGTFVQTWLKGGTAGGDAGAATTDGGAEQ